MPALSVVQVNPMNAQQLPCPGQCNCIVLSTDCCQEWTTGRVPCRIATTTVSDAAPYQHADIRQFVGSACGPVSAGVCHA